MNVTHQEIKVSGDVDMEKKRDFRITTRKISWRSGIVKNQTCNLFIRKIGIVFIM